MSDQSYRCELKYYINQADYIELRSRLRHIALPDPYAGPDGRYMVRSLYFDNYVDKAVTDKLSGLSRREKFRFRYYNSDTAFIRLEKKSKINKGCDKQSAQVAYALCEEVINGEYGNLLTSGSPLLAELYAKIRYQLLRPRTIVNYIREAYVHPAGNTRITIDSAIQSSNNTTGFLNPDIPAIPSAGGIILEIKYDGFLPGFILDAIRLGDRTATEFSKYVVARLL